MLAAVRDDVILLLSCCPSVRLSHGWISRKRLKLR